MVFSVCQCIASLAFWMLRDFWKKKRKSTKSLTNQAYSDFFDQSHDDDERRVRRREKNRVAAQRSRKKQTQKADKLHEEYECLEQENTSLKREIGKLTDEVKHLSDVLRNHEKICPLLHCSLNFGLIPRHEALLGPLPR
ncbi:basic leucine zipper transcriptional factor ATF-like 3 isoform X1 [Candoia aspera]|uniref:basic leucine zipper transcriptional factor ATF-like 3 isoform X1 n=1 Tax=Candoia aspera TaxID=51853 RepID=UPI002FD80A9C